MAYKVIDNFLPSEQAEWIRANLMGTGFPWFFNDRVADESEDPNVNGYQFTHNFYRNDGWTSDGRQLIQPIIDRINPTALIRIKANLNPVTAEHHYGGWHVDYEDIQCKTAVYYVNTNNGYTEFESGERVESVANRFVVFDSDMVHSGVTATNVKARCLINFNYV